MTGENVVRLYNEFNSISGYLNKLSWFEKQFHPFFELFPVFDPTLSFLNDPLQIEFLTHIYKTDSHIYAALRKEFVINDRVLVFDVRPINSYRQVFNQFIINGFISTDKQIYSLAVQLESKEQFDQNTLNILMEECDQSLLTVQDYLLRKKTRNFRIQFMTVFFQGYNDAQTGANVVFKRKKKFIELYLYSQGMLFANYHQKLITTSLQFEMPEKFIEPDKIKALDWKDQIIMLKKMGILDVLKKRIQHPVEAVQRKKIDSMVCMIIGQQPFMTDRITEFINTIEQGNPEYIKF